MDKHKGTLPESVEDFWRIIVRSDLSGDGEDIIYKWEEHLGQELETPNPDFLAGIYKLTTADIEQIRAIISEYRLTREQEETEREKRRLAEEKADAIVANHYADRIKKIIMSKPNEFLPKISTRKRSLGN